ncbi:spore protease YyaC [Oceanobacillus damuensis]|uniref:spore protease YyaC n=1 Tax=Oceanobacillus damuensis TaxID=937928 RepID=UPI00082C8DB1|nr:spore protease YyaC [Oceanobacillus damuensis]
MSLKSRFDHSAEHFRMPHNDSDILSLMSERIISWFPEIPREYVILCIGTDRSTGDALGPLAGTFLQESKPKHMNIYGTLHRPVHAVNLQESIDTIKSNHRNPFIIAIDACLGRNSSIGHIITEKGPLQPGSALNKALPPIGDINVTGVVNISGFMEHSILQSTRLSIVMDMARQISSILNRIDQRLTYNPSPSVVIPKEQQVKKWTV